MAENTELSTLNGAKKKLDQMIEFSEHQAINEMREYGITPYELMGTEYEELAKKYSYMLLPPASEEEALMFMSGVMHGLIKEQKVTKDGDVVDVVASAETRVGCAKQLLAYWQNGKKGKGGGTNIQEVIEVKSMDTNELIKEIQELKNSVNATLNRKEVKKELKQIEMKRKEEEVAEIKEIVKEEYKDKMEKELKKQKRDLEAKYKIEMKKKIKVVKKGEEPTYVLSNKEKVDDILAELDKINKELENYTPDTTEYDEGCDE